jgi:thioredoxin-dependent peroxiredoxin
VQATNELKKMNIAFFAASVDPADVNKKFAESLDAKYPILSDPDKKVAKAFGVLGPRGFAQRWTFYVDKEGIVRHIDKRVNVQSHGKDVAAKAKELGFDKT